MIKKRIFATALLIALLISMIACNGSNDGNGGETDSEGYGATDTSDSSETGKATIKIVDNGAVAGIVYPSNYDASATNAANALASSLKSISGVKMIIPHSDSDKYDADKVEILIGKTQYAESLQVYDKLKYGQGSVSVIGNKVVVAGYDGDSLTQMVNRLTVALSTAKDANGNIALATDYNASASAMPLAETLPVFNGSGVVKIEHVGSESLRMVFTDVKASETQSYASAILTNGYTKHAENKIDNNLYYTFYNETSVVSLMYLDRTAGGEMVMVIDDASVTSLVPLESENQYTATTQTTFTQLGLYYDSNKEANEAAKNMQYFNGQCQVMRLCDGRFIIIDGGHQTQGHADRLYELLKKQAPDPDNITVAAWIFTHHHGDHVGFFEYFARTYANKVKVERFIHNFVGMGIIGDMKTFFKDAEITRTQPGQKFYLADATVEMLYTPDIYNGNVNDLADENLSSLVFTIKANGTKFIFFGDYYDTEGTVKNIYSKDTLKSDVMQVPHHGISGSTDSINTIVEAKYAFWPVAMLEADNGSGGKKGYVYWKEGSKAISVDLLGRTPNDYFVDVLDFDNNVFVAQDDVFTATFNDGTLSVTRYENMASYLDGTVAD